MEPNTTPQTSMKEKKDGKIWLIILALVILVLIVLFVMDNTTKAPANQETGVAETEQIVNSVDEVDNTASILQQLKNIDIGSVENDLIDIDADIQSVQ